ncbi:response regulator [Microbacterium bovistercoris]|uniref:Response regulator n=1 Tax=Microbacterium bovistercoris TaxID=2293570 RepID=A0A371NXN7_9MICO|nr:response regulator [Microbacterium bovistercoris]REJ08070.1 response regulator [Microbacterium bovistercoris]
MYMSAELIATLSAFITLGVGMFAGFAWMLHRMDTLEGKLTARIDEKTDGLDTKLGARIDALDTKLDSVDNRLGARIDALEAKLDAVDGRLSARIESVQSELVEVKIAIARIEPPRHLIVAR